MTNNPFLQSVVNVGTNVGETIGDIAGRSAGNLFSFVDQLSADVFDGQSISDLIAAIDGGAELRSLLSDTANQLPLPPHRKELKQHPAHSRHYCVSSTCRFDSDSGRCLQS
ncbi:MAG: hypothetical protein R3C05_08605 [Pirellulaceae bacterium]